MSRNVPAREECQQKLEALQEVHKEDRHEWLGIVDSLIGELAVHVGTPAEHVFDRPQRAAARAALSADARAALDRHLRDAAREGDATPGAKSGGGRRKSKKNKSKKKRSKKRKSKKRKTKRIKKRR